MSKSDSKTGVYKFDTRLDGEDVLSYLARHNALGGPEARQATEEEMKEFDRTEEILAAGVGGFTLFPHEPATRRTPPRRRKAR